MEDAVVIRFLKELRRRRVFRLAGIYVVAIWLLLQAANILFPAWGIPDAAIRYLLWAGLLGFPVALVFGWVFDVTTQGIRRTQPVISEDELLRSLPLRRADYLILGAFVLVIGAIVYDTTDRVMRTPAMMDEWRPSAAEIEAHSVAVLPFASLSADPEQEYFADGISEEILNRLSAFRELKVIARTSSFAFKDSGYDIGRISGLLAVNYLLQGSVRRDGERLRIAAQLVDRTGVQVWASSFDRELGAIFVLQDEIAEAVATSIVPQILPPPVVAREPDLEAFQEFLIGREHMTKRTAVYFQRGAERFDRAIELDPEFADAYAARAIALTANSVWSEDQTAVLEQAQHDIGRALELDPQLALAHAAQGFLYTQQQRDPRERERVLRRALELDPGLVDAMNWLAGALSSQGRDDEAYQVLYRAARIDPLAPTINVSLASRDSQRGLYAEAERRLLRLADLPQLSTSVAVSLLQLYRVTGRLADEITTVKRFTLELSRQAGRVTGAYTMSNAYATLGMIRQPEYWLDRWRQEWSDTTVVRLNRARILGLETGHVDYASALAEFLAELQAGGIAASGLDPIFRKDLGALYAFAGRREEAFEILLPLVADDRSRWYVSAHQTLAWLFLQSDEPQRGMALLEPIEQDCRRRQAEDRLHRSDLLASCALTVSLVGEHQRALDLLERAADAGWREYYAVRRDPRWDGLRDEPRFQIILARVIAEVDAQRAIVEGVEAEEDFVARYDAAMAVAQQARRDRQ